MAADESVRNATQLFCIKEYVYTLYYPTLVTFVNLTHSEVPISYKYTRPHAHQLLRLKKLSGLRLSLPPFLPPQHAGVTGGLSPLPSPQHGMAVIQVRAT